MFVTSLLFIIDIIIRDATLMPAMRQRCRQPTLCPDIDYRVLFYFRCHYADMRVRMRVI